MRCIQNYMKKQFYCSLRCIGALFFHYASIKTQNLKTNQNLDYLNVCTSQTNRPRVEEKKRERSLKIITLTPKQIQMTMKLLRNK